MRDYAVAHEDDFEATPDELFLLGLLHDVGYAFVEKQENHAAVGGELLRKQGYKYWREVSYHGSAVAQTIYDSPELRLLNYVDMTTSPTGETVTIEERIADIQKCYGENSAQALEAIELANLLKT